MVSPVQANGKVIILRREGKRSGTTIVLLSNVMLCDAFPGTYTAVYEARMAQITTLTPRSLMIQPAGTGFSHPPALQVAQTTGTEAQSRISPAGDWDSISVLKL